MSEASKSDESRPEEPAPETGRSDDPAADTSEGMPEVPGEQDGADSGSKEIPPDSELAEALREKDQFRALLQRAQADFINFRSRVENEKTEIRKAARRSLITRLLEVMDNLDAALSEDMTAGVDDKFVGGV